MRIKPIQILNLALALHFLAAPAAAHEFWVVPERYIVKPGARIVARLAVGQMMKGVSMPFIARNIKSFTVTDRNGTRAVKGADGDDPALSIATGVPGLHVIAHHTTANKATFKSWEDFEYYLAYEGLERFAEAHRARGLPASGFNEAYSRCARALVQVGRYDPRDRDRATGMPFELVAEDNPYRPGAGAVSVKLLRAGKPVGGHPVAVFRYRNKVTRTLVPTGADGKLKVSIAGGGSFLLNSVDLQPVEGADVVWSSHWASLSFAIPLRRLPADRTGARSGSDQSKD